MQNEGAGIFPGALGAYQPDNLARMTVARGRHRHASENPAVGFAVALYAGPTRTLSAAFFREQARQTRRPNRLRICRLSGFSNEPGKYSVTTLMREHNRQQARIRVMAEHIFVDMVNSMNSIYLSCIGLVRATKQIGLANFACNFCHCIQLPRLGRVQTVW